MFATLLQLKNRSLTIMECSQSGITFALVTVLCSAMIKLQGARICFASLVGGT